MYFTMLNLCYDKKKYKEVIISQKYICTVCDYIYDPALGDLDSSMALRTAFEDISDDWECPVCVKHKGS